jgi:uncharacterized protein (TIGR01777 family)
MDMPPTNPATEQFNLAITGASGLIGSALYRMLDKTHFRITVVGRSVEKLKGKFPQAIAHMTWQDFENSSATDYDAIVNLAGASASGHRWTDDYKQTMLESRITATQQCVAKCRQNSKIHLINASAVSAYGLYDEPYIRFTEQNHDQRASNAFLQELADRWEEAALKAGTDGNPVTLLRTGVVLDRTKGALPEMMKPFKIFVGGKVGSGKQMISWISITDITQIIAFLLQHPDITGPVNCVAPGACSNAAFSKALGKALGRPSIFPTPAFVLRAAMGQMAEELILKGQHVYPEKLLDAGFQFRHQNIEDCFRETFTR